MKPDLILVPALLTLVVLTLVTVLYPPSDDFHPLNPQWNGMERIVRGLDATRVKVTDAYVLDPLSHTLLIIGPCKPFTLEDAKAIETFLVKGGRVIIADDYGTANQLLEILGAPILITSGVLTDPLLNIGSPQLSLAWWGSKKVALNYAAALNVSACNDCRILAESSLFSFLDLNSNGRHDSGEPEGPLPVATSLCYGTGELVVIADSSIFINSMTSLESNPEILSELLRGTRPAIISDRWCETTFTTIKNQLTVTYQLLGSPEIKYALAVGVLVLSIRKGQRLVSRRR